MDGRHLWTDVAYMDALNSGSGLSKLSKYSKKSKNFRKGTPVDKVGRYENCTKIFVFRLSVFRVHFPEKTRNPETVTETHGLIANYIFFCTYRQTKPHTPYT